MVAPVVTTERLQYAPETVAETLVAATRVVDVLHGTIAYRRAMKSIVVRNAGSFASAHRGYAGEEETQIDYSSSATYDRLADVGNLFFNAVATGTGTGATRTWTFTPSDTADLLKRYSFEYGGTNFPTAYLLNGGTGHKLDVVIKPNESWQLKQSIIGVATTTGSITGSLSLPSSLTGDDVLWTQTKVYIDTSSAYGTTQKVGDIISAEFTLTNGQIPRYTLDASAAPYTIVLANARAVSCKIVARYDAQTEYTAAFASTPQRVQIKATGNSSRSAKININGYWDSIPFANDNGEKVVEMNLRGLYDPTVLSSDVQLIVVNGVSTLTSIP